MIESKILEKVKKHLLITGGLHIQIPEVDEEGLTFKQILPYHNAMIDHSARLKYITSISDAIEACGEIIVLAMELDSIDSVLTGREIKSYIGSEFGEDYYSETRPLLSLIIDNIHYLLYTPYAHLQYIPLIINYSSMVLFSLLKMSGIKNEDLEEALNSVLEVVVKHKMSKLHLHLKTAQYYVAIDYLKTIRVEPTSENANKYLMYNDVEIDGELMCRYWGEPTREEGKYTTILMRPKANTIKGEMQEYQIRNGKGLDEERQYFTVVRVKKDKSGVDVIKGPYVKKMGISL
jgi:hypothetical protein